MLEQEKILPRKTLAKIQPYSPGKPIWEVQSELGLDKVIKLASNENPVGPSPLAVKAIAEHIHDINRYPDAGAMGLKEALSKQFDVGTDQLIVTNGADELITLISETYLEENDEIIVPSPSFSEYDFGANLMGAKVVEAPLDENYHYQIEPILAAITEKTKLIYLCSPNNPTGTYLSKSQLHSLLESLPKHILVVFDGAYSHFATSKNYSDGIEFVKQGFPIMVMQTFSKIYGLAGVRIGFGIASQKIIKDILKVKEPFNVNTLAQVAATAALMDTNHLDVSRKVNEKGRLQMYEVFEQLGVQYIESMSNFILVRIGQHAADVYDQLLANGIIVRSGNMWGLNEFLRISIGTYEENNRLLETMRKILYDFQSK